jgi:hypothetical protein
MWTEIKAPFDYKYIQKILLTEDSHTSHANASVSTQDTKRPLTREAKQFDDYIPEERCEPVP